MKRRQRLIAISTVVAAALLLAACSSVRHVRPIDKGELVATASAGGPFVGQIGWAPLPLLSAGVNYGVSAHFDIEAGWEITSALFGIMQLDGGINWRPLAPENWRPGIIAGVRLLGATNFRADESRLWPGAGATALWKLTPKCYCYLGLDNWFETHGTRYDGNSQRHHWLPLVHTGIDIGNKSWQVQIEGVWYVPNIDGTRHTVKTVELGRQGCLGVFLGASHSFGIMPWARNKP